MKRVVITGMAGLSPIGSEWPAVERALRSLRNGVRYMPNWDNYQGLNTRLAAPIEDFELPEHYTRKRTRSMGRVALLATRASELALLDAGLLNDPILTSGLAGVA
ncbi:MAG TPA: beta-ketoacyl synthase N-terminal-like domain-containing protein, partial [Defluviicoccus sp.]|nr:beta-ketoacyl synthase N-terminal-like domain-containing protein [Defluviicoccus sp.]